MVMDNPTEHEWLTDEATTCSCAAVLCLDSLLSIPDAVRTRPPLAGKKGWYLGLRAHEQVVTSAITVFGNVTFSTHVPVPAARLHLEPRHGARLQHSYKTPGATGNNRDGGHGRWSAAFAGRGPGHARQRTNVPVRHRW